MTRSDSGVTTRPPSTIAVAVTSGPGRDACPRVTASGRGFVAEQIVELAFANGVKVRQDADLVQVLAALDLESDIPVEAIVAVAEILRRVYEANGPPSPAQPEPP